MLRGTTPLSEKEICVVKLRLRDNESVQDAVRRFRKLVEHAGIKKELRKREFFEKPSEARRRDRRRAKRRASTMNELAKG
jgi:small subunit ribosomal protein S21